MSSTDARSAGDHPPHGAVGYLQLPSTDVPASIAFYEAVLGWRGEATHASFEAPGLDSYQAAQLLAETRTDAGGVTAHVVLEARDAAAQPRATAWLSHP